MYRATLRTLQSFINGFDGITLGRVVLIENMAVVVIKFKTARRGPTAFPTLSAARRSLHRSLFGYLGYGSWLNMAEMRLDSKTAVSRPTDLSRCDLLKAASQQVHRNVDDYLIDWQFTTTTHSQVTPTLPSPLEEG